MLYQAYLASREQDGPYVPTKPISEMRTIVRESILSNNIMELAPPLAIPPVAQSPLNEPFSLLANESVFDSPPPVNDNGCNDAGGLLSTTSSPSQTESPQESAKDVNRSECGTALLNDRMQRAIENGIVNGKGRTNDRKGTVGFSSSVGKDPKDIGNDQRLVRDDCVNAKKRSAH